MLVPVPGLPPCEGGAEPTPKGVTDVNSSYVGCDDPVCLGGILTVGDKLTSIITLVNLCQSLGAPKCGWD